MVVYLWKFLWGKVHASLHYFKIALSIVVVYLLIISVFARTFQTNKARLYPKKVAIHNNTDIIYSFITNKKINASAPGRIIVSLYKSAVCSLIGEACYTDLNKKNPVNTSSFIASLFAYPFLNPPASGIGAVQQTLAEAGFIPKSYAAEGVGFASIRPLMNVWKAMRDVAYLMLVLVIVTIGFMIMFRSKLNPQTVINVENSLPKIVMALIYITFSFAIAGFLIDLMYVSLILIISILGPQQVGATVKSTKDNISWFLQAGPGSLFGVFTNFDGMLIMFTLPNALLSILGDFAGAILRLIIIVASAFFINPFVGKFLDWTTTLDIPFGINLGVVATLEGGLKSILGISKELLVITLSVLFGVVIATFLLGIIILLSVLLLFFRVFFLLFSNYIKLFVLIIISPLYLLLEAVPGQSTFGSWIKNLLEMLVTFPVIIATFLIGSIIIDTSTQGILWTPPFLVGLNAQYLSAIIGVWILFTIPDFIGIVQKMVNPKPLPLDAGIGTFFGGAKTGVETGLGEMSKYALLAGQFAPLGRLFDMIPGFKRNKG